MVTQSARTVLLAGSAVRVDSNAPMPTGSADPWPGQLVAVQNTSLTTIYLGATSAVTTTVYGYELKPGGEHEFNLGAEDQLWAVAPVAGTPINIMRTRV